jgi:hypothetical protein
MQSNVKIRHKIFPGKTVGKQKNCESWMWRPCQCQSNRAKLWFSVFSVHSIFVLVATSREVY